MTGTVELRSKDKSEADAFARRMPSELEQAHVVAEDFEQRLAEAMAANRALEAQLLEERRRREAAEKALAEIRQATAVMDQTQSGEAELRRQLGITLEELQVMAEELEVAQDTIRHLSGGD